MNNARFLDIGNDNKQVVHSESNRLGKFNIHDDVLRDSGLADMLKALFALCKQLDEFRNESGRGQTYICASELFQPLAEGEEIPQYRIEFVEGAFADPEHEARRLDHGAFGFVAIRQHILRVPPATLHDSLKLPNVH